MDSIKGALTAKIAGVPGFVWAAGLGLAAFFILPRFLGSSSSSPGSSAGNVSSGGDFQSGYAQGFNAGQGYAGQTASGAPPSGSPPPGRPSHPLPAVPPPQPPPVPGNPADGIYPGLPVGLPMNARLTGVPGVGGPPVGSLSADELEDHHPTHRRRVIYPHYVRVGGGGGPAAHRARVHAIARQAGLNPARLMALNPDHRTRLIRVA